MEKNFYELLPNDVSKEILVDWLEMVDVLHLDTAMTTHSGRPRWKTLLNEIEICPRYDCAAYFIYPFLSPICILSDNRIITVAQGDGGDSSVLMILNVTDGSYSRFNQDVPGLIREIFHIPSRELVLCSTSEYEIFVFDLDDLCFNHSFLCRPFRFFAAFPNGLLLLDDRSPLNNPGGEFPLIAWNYLEVAELRSLVSHSTINLVLSDGRFLSCTAAGLATIWDVSDINALQCVREINLKSRISNIYELPNSQLLIQYYIDFFSFDLNTEESSRHFSVHTYDKLTVIDSSTILYKDKINGRTYAYNMDKNTNKMIGKKKLSSSSWNWSPESRIIIKNDRILTFSREKKLLFSIWNINRNDCERVFHYPDDAPYHATAQRLVRLPNDRFIVHTTCGLMIWSPVARDIDMPKTQTMIISLK